MQPECTDVEPLIVAFVVRVAATALRDPEFATAARAFAASCATLPAAPNVHMTRGEYARSRRISTATVARLVADGMPTIPVGTTDRIDPVAADAWRSSRERKATTPATKKDVVDVAGALSKAGLRSIAGGRGR